jgi:Phosphopantetheine attachment site
MLGETYAAVLSTMAGRAEAAARAETAPAAAAAPSAPRPRDGAGDSPRDPAERAIAEVWAELLGLARVGIHDDFRALGGHSLVAMRVSARLRSDHGLDVSPHEVLRRRTVAALARPLAPAPDDSVVWLRRDGTGTPLVCVHPGGGGVHWYRELADALDRPVLALQHPAARLP